MQIAGVKLSDARFWKLVEIVQAELRDAARLETQQVTPEMLKRAARRLLERKLSLIAGKYITVTDKVWQRWQDVFVPQWLIKEVLQDVGQS